MIRGGKIGSRFAGARFNTYEVNEYNEIAFDACRAFAEIRYGGIILIGPVGIGKTHLLLSIARAMSSEKACEFNHESDRFEVKGEQFDVEFWPVLDLAAALRRDVVDGDGKLVERVMNCDMLILDDLGREKHSDFLLQELQRIIDYRYRDERPIAVGTNLTRTELVQRYDESTVSRWVESCKILDVGGPDFRIEMSTRVDSAVAR
ncbi:ATP-binding protein [Candidatus Bipolaricaulota bacterium]